MDEQFERLIRERHEYNQGRYETPEEGSVRARRRALCVVAMEARLHGSLKGAYVCRELGELYFLGTDGRMAALPLRDDAPCCSKWGNRSTKGDRQMAFSALRRLGRLDLLPACGFGPLARAAS